MTEFGRPTPKEWPCSPKLQWNDSSSDTLSPAAKERMMEALRENRHE